MADRPVDTTELILRDIQRTLGEQTRMLGEQGGNTRDMRGQMHEWQETTATALGFASHANIRIESLQKQVDELPDRLDRLERQH